MNKAQRAFDVLASKSCGVLSTMSLELPGYPFGSIVSYALISVIGLGLCPVLLLSDLAQHTKNIDENPRVSLTVWQEGDDPQNQARVTWVGQAAKDFSLKEEYVRSVPGSERYSGMPDFNAFVISPIRVRYIEGFARIYWIEKEELHVST